MQFTRNPHETSHTLSCDTTIRLQPQPHIVGVPLTYVGRNRLTPSAPLVVLSLLLATLSMGCFGRAKNKEGQTQQGLQNEAGELAATNDAASDAVKKDDSDSCSAAGVVCDTRSQICKDSKCVARKDYMYCNVGGKREVFKKLDPKNPCNPLEAECRSKGKYFDIAKNEAGRCIEYNEIEPFEIEFPAQPGKPYTLAVNVDVPDALAEYEFELDCGEGGIVNEKGMQKEVYKGTGEKFLLCAWMDEKATRENVKMKLTGRFRAVNVPCFLEGEDAPKVLLEAVTHWSGNPWHTFEVFANECTNFKRIPKDTSPILTFTESTAGMFLGCTNFDQDISKWDLSNVTNMERMFNGCMMFNQDIGDWDVSNVTKMNYMVSGTGLFNQDIGRWDVSNVTDMEKMFAMAGSFNQNLKNWNVANAKETFNGIFVQSAMERANAPASLQ